MKLALRSIADLGDIEKERITLLVEADCDVGDYLIAHTGLKGEDLTTDIQHAFWFPYKKVKKGDLVVIYTKRGELRQNTLKSGKQAHFYYWGLAMSIWQTQNSAAVLMEAPQYIGEAVDKLKR